MTITGGCQCGAARFEVKSLGGASICHCRMCQKAFGSFFGPLVTTHGLKWTRGEPKRFASSNKARRGFCGHCGTPLTYEYDWDDEPIVEVAIGALDDPELAPPAVQVNPENRLSFFATLHQVPDRGAADAAKMQDFYGSIVSNLHPDHPTDDDKNWPKV
ncbi:aldehyde-activating protein [Notoacmeibacter marinus]|uniref:Aldehyde-activating protein n=1 Tax=Notoacmeibacter marinus TaxID=1876515 RepID=A0A231UTT6_9HYPH|nr:GFA family protein [Notoacmeibacter marinus]OXS99348.1 aldehyde-activating protein [Notoacmeibacter marinus]